MHVRFTSIRGIPVVDEDDDVLGEVVDVLIHPEKGKIEGFFVCMPTFLSQAEHLFLSTFDIIRWGTEVHIRSADVLAPIEDRIRLQSLMEDSRSVLGQKMKTERGRVLGRCKDIQFSTDSWRVEWLFPRKLFRWGIALPIVEVIEVRKDAIIVRDPEATVKEAVKEQSVMSEIAELTDSSVPTPSTFQKR